MNVMRGNKFQARSVSMRQGQRRGTGFRGLPRSYGVTAQPPISVGRRIPMVTPNVMGPPLARPGSIRPSFVTNNGSSGRGKKYTPLRSSSSRLGGRRGATSRSRTPRSAPTSSTDDSRISNYIVALTEGRGHARGEVGIAALEIAYPHLILCQISDNQEYINTLRKINVFNPVEIVVPNTFCVGPEPSVLYKCLQNTFPSVTITSVLRRHFSDTSGLQQIHHLCAYEYSSVEIVVSQKFYALASAAALIKYGEFCLNRLFSPRSLKVEYQGSQNSMVIDMKTAQLLELTQNLRDVSSSYCLMGILNHCHTHGGVRLLRATILEPPCLPQIIVSRLDCVQELLENSDLLQALDSLLPSFNNVDHLMTLSMHMPQQHNLQVAEYQMKYTLQLKCVLELLPKVVVALEDCTSEFLCSVRDVMTDERFSKVLNRILSVMHQDARTAKGAASSEIQRNFAIKAGVCELLDLSRQAYCEIVSGISDLVSNLAETYHLPLKVKCSGNWGYHIELTLGKRQLKKEDLPTEFVQVHKSKNTFSFTTQDLILADLRSKETMKEVTKLSNVVICRLLADIRGDIGCIFKLCEMIAELDMLTSFANLSSLNTYVRPQFGTNLNLKQSRHPILDNFLPQVPVANDVYASPDYNCRIITGPNMSGKSIYIRQIALLQVLAQIGCYIPAQSAMFRIADHIFSRLGYDDSIECNASTFVLELKEFQYISQMITPTSLVIVDELCRGTSCEEGTAIAWTIVEELLQHSAYIFITTHFLYLTKLQDVYCNAVNQHFETLEDCTESGREQLIYTHKLLNGVTQLENYGLRLARGLAFPETILENATITAEKMSSERKAFTSNNAVATTEHEYYRLASLALEYQREGNLNGQKIKELQDMFSHLKAPGVEIATVEERDSETDLVKSTGEHQDSEEEDPIGADDESRTSQDDEKHSEDLIEDSQQENIDLTFEVTENENEESHPQENSNSRISFKFSDSQNQILCNSPPEEPMEVEYAEDRPFLRPPLFSLPYDVSEPSSFQTILDSVNQSVNCEKEQL